MKGWCTTRLVIVFYTVPYIQILVFYSEHLGRNDSQFDLRIFFVQFVGEQPPTYKVGPKTSYKWGEITPISRVKYPQLLIYKSIYRGPIIPFKTIVGPRHPKS